jgi:glucokinase
VIDSEARTGSPGSWSVGVDIGGTKIAAGLADESGMVARQIVRPTPLTRGPAGILDAVSTLVSELRRQLPPHVTLTGLGVGTGGVVDPASGRVTSSTDLLPDWAGTAIGAELQERTGLIVVADNDVNAMAIGEHIFGAGRPFQDVVYVAVGTGLGAGLVMGDHLWRGRRHAAGEIAHLPVGLADTHGRPCSCGRFGHLEAAVSGPALVAAYRQISGDQAVSGLQEVAVRAEHGDAMATGVLTEGATYLGRALAGLAAVLDPEAIVVGGGVSGAGPSLWKPLRSAWDAEGPPCAQLLAATLDVSALIGAAWLGRHGHQPATEVQTSIGRALG